VHYKINYIKAFAVGFAVGTKTISRVGFPVQLHTGRFIFVKRAVYSILLIRFVAVMLDYF
jgi:hypothetical protein